MWAYGPTSTTALIKIRRFYKFTPKLPWEAVERRKLVINAVYI